LRSDLAFDCPYSELFGSRSHGRQQAKIARVPSSAVAPAPSV
jgi:hypothetical protein